MYCISHLDCVKSIFDLFLVCFAWCRNEKFAYSREAMIQSAKRVRMVISFHLEEIMSFLSRTK